MEEGRGVPTPADRRRRSPPQEGGALQEHGRENEKVRRAVSGEVHF